MRKLLLLLTAAIMLAVAGGCMYTAMAADTNGKVYLTRTNLGGFWNNQWICEPNGGQLNCKEAQFEGAAGPTSSAEPAPAAKAESTTPPPAEGEGGMGGENVE